MVQIMSMNGQYDLRLLSPSEYLNMIYTGRHIDRASISISALQSSLSAHAVFAIPLSRSVPKILIRTRPASNLVSQKILVSIDC